MRRMGMTGAACALLLSLTGRPVAAVDRDSVLKVLYENTLTCQGGAANDNWLCYDWYYPGGYVREFQILRRRDGNMAVSGRQGTYTVSGDAGTLQVCQSFDAGRHSWCRELGAHQVGDKWEEPLATGGTQKYSLLKGRLLLNFLSGDGSDTHILAPYKYPDYPPDPSHRMRDIGGAASR